MPLSQLAPEQALRRLELQIVRRLEGFLRGEHLGLLPGPGTDMAEARTYIPGEDDVRRMDWAVTARTTIPHVRDVIADRELETWVLVDLSPSMHFGTAAMEKRDLAVAAVATMGLLTFRVGDRFGGYVLRDGTLKRWPARSGRLALFGLLRSLLRDAVPGRAAPTQSLAQSITAVARSQRKRGLRVVVSDFIDMRDSASDPETPPSWERAMRELGARHQSIAVEIIDPRELTIPNVGTVLLQDPETGVARELNTADRKTRQRYAAAASLQRRRTAWALRRAGVAHLVLRTDRDWVADTARFALKHRRVAARLHQPPTGVMR
ncbi:MAG: DUF58 domain-containing protein [Nocardioidaceae bacterium]|nr:DUF58 domain-containing protein [Nocardioidaceae bacterium]